MWSGGGVGEALALTLGLALVDDAVVAAALLRRKAASSSGGKVSQIYQ